MIFIAITELNEEGGSCEEAISEFIESKYESLPFAHTSLLSHHLAKLVEKRELLCDYYNNNYCYSLPGERKIDSSTDDAERKCVEITLGRNDQCAAANEEVMDLQNVEKSAEIWKSGIVSLKRKACGDMDVTEVSDPGAKACLSGVAIEPEVALEKSGSEGRIEANNGGGELREVVVLDEQSDVLMEEKMLKQCREKDQQKKAFSDIDDVSRLPLSMESCEELRKLARKIESQLSEIIGSYVIK
ncbi:hypothetical protein N665_0025s0160, partial [Sinapis alba]